jgi:hypothetical protein
MSVAFDIESAGLGVGAVKIGRIVGVDAEGNPLVDFPGNPGGPVAARSTVILQREMLAVERETLLLFAEDDPRQPVIMGLLQDNPVCPLPKLGKLAPRSPLEVSADGRRLTVTAYSELHLQCGESSITLRRDGKISIQGKYVLSKADVCNRIKGGSVQIN